MAFNRSSINLGNRYQQQSAASDSYGEARQSFMNWAGVKLKFFSMKKEMDRVNLNILPYQIRSSKHPEVVAGRRKIGDWDYLLDVWVHRNLGPNKKDMLCPKATYGKACPACEERSKLYDQGRDEEARAYSPSRRTIFNVQLIGRNGPEPEPLIFATSHQCFNKELIEEASASSNGNGITFADPGPSGQVVSFRVSEKTLGSSKFCEAKSFQFLDRDEEVSDEVLEQCESLDEYLIVPTSQQIVDAMYGEEGDDADAPAPAPAEDPEPPARREPEPEPARSARDDLDAMGMDGYRGRERTREPVPEDGEADLPPAEPPARRRREPEPEPEPARESSPCPHGLNWGTDCDRHRACGTCPDAIYDKCRAAGARRR